MKKDIAIEVNKVSKKFSKDLKHAVRYGLTDITKNAVGLDVNSGKLRNGEFWAVDDVSFKVKKGETLGIIGPNGSGKTTLLQLLNGIYMPDKGSIKMRGRISALIAVGAGFHQMLTGRENIYINGSILGMDKREIDNKFNEIVEFADIGDFLDSPVKTYSSGMSVRLGFSIAVHSIPEILLVDEVLAVGDEDFRRKCISKMRDVVERGSTVVFVSHNLNMIQAFTDKCMLMLDGGIKSIGSTPKVLSEYLKLDEDLSLHNDGTFDVLLKGIKIKNFRLDTDSVKGDFNTPLIFNFKIRNIDKYETMEVGIGIRNSLQSRILTSRGIIKKLPKGDGNVRVELRDHHLPPGDYSLDLGITLDNILMIYKERVFKFRISKEKIRDEYLIRKGDKIGVYLPLNIKVQ